MKNELRRCGSVLACALSALAARAPAQEVIYATESRQPQLLVVDPANGNVLATTPISGEQALFRRP